MYRPLRRTEIEACACPPPLTTAAQLTLASAEMAVDGSMQCDKSERAAISFGASCFGTHSAALNVSVFLCVLPSASRVPEETHVYIYIYIYTHAYTYTI